MFYYISTNQWNLLESFVSESISPFSFYKIRGYGNNLSRYIDGTKERTDYLILSTEEIGGNYVIKVNEEILDKSNLTPIKRNKTLFQYSKTIYYKKGAVFFLFSSNDLLESIVAESQVLFEVKCIEKYRSEFVVSTSTTKLLNTTGEISNSISFQRDKYVTQDCIFDKLKGMIVAYTCALAFAENAQEQRLTCQLRGLKNSFTGLNTQVMVSDTAILNKNEYISLIEETKNTYNDIIKTKTNLFDILIQQLSEITKLSKARAEELSKNKHISNYEIENLRAQKENLERRLYYMEDRDGVVNLLEELISIKNQECDNGIKKGKTREYFKKGTWEYERKQFLKNEIQKYETENQEYKSIKQEICNIKQLITSIETGGSMYDTTLGALFVRVSDIINELIAKAKKSSKHLSSVDYSCISFGNSVIDVYNTQTSVEEEAFLVIIINEALKSEKRILSDDVVLNLILESANKYKNTKYANTENGKLILSSLREFWAYKHNQCFSFCIPNNLIVLRSLMAFFIKPFGFDQIDRYVQNKSIEHKEYGYMLRGALIGYAALPKTFTDALYVNKDIYVPMDNYLTTIHKQVETQYPCD